MWYIHLESGEVISQYEVQRASLSVKQAIIRLKNQNKPIREIRAKTLGVAKSTVWYILKKRERTGELSNTKRPGRPQKTSVVDDRPILSLIKKNPSQQLARSRKLSRRKVYLCPSQQLREDFTRGNTEVSPQGVNHW